MNWRRIGVLFPHFRGTKGKFAVIQNNQLIGVFQTYAEALTDGYKAAGLKPFLVKQIAIMEVAASHRAFTRSWPA